ncbi:MAG: hypothetical protein P8L30_15150 [Longimicrobiales bacterium]|nr:hypothetical protein [Longimicrobiales bacterium]
MRRPITWSTCVLALVIAACGEGDVEAADAETVVDETAYQFRLDSQRSDLGDFQVTEEDDAVRILTGPAGIAYHTADSVNSGNFRIDATFTQYGAPLGYREAYGVFVGGRELDGPELEYTYFLVRPTGDYLIKRRVGEITETIVDWTPHDGVMQVLAEGDEPENTMTIEAADGQINFIINSQLAHSMIVSEARPHGIAGLRANHRLDIRITGWSVTGN